MGRAGRISPERRFVRFAATMVVLVAAVQVLMRFEGPRRLLNRSIRLEGEALSQSVDGLNQDAYPWLEWPPPDACGESSAWATLYLRFIGSPPKDAWALVNGRIAKRLGPGGGTVTVREGDVVEVYCPNREVSVVVSAATDNLVCPELGTWVVGSETAVLGSVKLR